MTSTSKYMWHWVLKERIYISIIFIHVRQYMLLKFRHSKYYCDFSFVMFMGSWCRTYLRNVISYVIFIDNVIFNYLISMYFLPLVDPHHREWTFKVVKPSDSVLTNSGL